jgi:hypothetical protein
VFLAGCSPPPTVFDLPEGVRMLTFHTYEGSGQVAHPDVLKIDALRGGPFWMAVTPYPFSDEKFENPSIYRSRDGISWEEPRAGINPVAPRPPFDHNSDPDLVYHEGELLLFFLETQRREYRPDSLHFQRLRVTRSRDGRDWSPSVEVIHWDLDEDPLYVSPTVVRGPGGFRLYLVDPANGRIVWLPSSDLVHFEEAAGTLEIGLPGLRPWHLDVFPVEGGWVALLCARGPDAKNNLDVDLWIGASPDLDHWVFQTKPILGAGPELLDTEVVYRSTGLTGEGRLGIWFSAKTIPGRWIVGVTTFEDRLVRDLLGRR